MKEKRSLVSVDSLYGYRVACAKIKRGLSLPWGGSKCTCSYRLIWPCYACSGMSPHQTQASGTYLVAPWGNYRTCGLASRGGWVRAALEGNLESSLIPDPYSMKNHCLCLPVLHTWPPACVLSLREGLYPQNLWVKISASSLRLIGVWSQWREKKLAHPVPQQPLIGIKFLCGWGAGENRQSMKSDIPVPLLFTVPELYLSSYQFSKNILVGLSRDQSPVLESHSCPLWPSTFNGSRKPPPCLPGFLFLLWPG